MTTCILSGLNALSIDQHINYCSMFVVLKFFRIQPGFVLRSYILPEGTKKMFMNICQSDTVEPAKSEPVKDSNGRTGEKWNIPYSLTTPREDLDKGITYIYVCIMVSLRHSRPGDSHIKRVSRKRALLLKEDLYLC